MKKQDKKLYPIKQFFKNSSFWLYLGILLLAIFVFIVFSATWRPNRQVAVPIIETETTANAESVTPPIEIDSKSKILTANSGTKSATVLAGDTTVPLLFTDNTIFYDALVQARSQGQIVFDGKNYPGLGFFITDIGTLHSGGGKHLLYYINGEEATVGVSTYTLKDGDIIEWKLE